MLRSSLTHEKKKREERKREKKTDSLRVWEARTDFVRKTPLIRYMTVDSARL